MEVSPLKKGVNGLTEVVPNYGNIDYRRIWLLDVWWLAIIKRENIVILVVLVKSDVCGIICNFDL